MPATSISQQQLFGIARAVQEGKKSPSSVSGAARHIAADVSPKSVHDFASTKHKGLPKHHHKQSSEDRLGIAFYISKAADFNNSLRGVENALHHVHKRRSKMMDDFSKKVQKENQSLRKEVSNASQAAQSASQAAQNAQSMSQAQQTEAAQLQQQASPAAQPAYGAVAAAGQAASTQGSGNQNQAS
jgi:Skp family chaperone for outer membrane proteins